MHRIPTKPLTILIVRVSSLGDVVHTLPAVFLLKRLYPAASISWVVQEKVASLLYNQPLCDHLFILRDKYLHIHNLKHTLSLLQLLRATHWDLIFDFQGLPKTSLLILFLTGTKIGFDKQHARMGITSIINHYRITPAYTNIIQKNLALTSSVAIRKVAYQKGFEIKKGYEHANPTLEDLKVDFLLEISAEKKQIVTSWLKDNNIDRYLIFSPNTTWQSKLWPLEYWKLLIEYTREQFPEFGIVLLGSQFDNQARQLALYGAQKKIPLALPPLPDLHMTTFLISQAALLIAPDTGMLHIADFLGIQTLGIFGPTLAHRHGPFLQQKNKENSIQIPCIHLYQKGSTAPHTCMKTLLPEELLIKMKNTLQ